jgi:magnesium-transporting ATPase (P-type)
VYRKEKNVFKGVHRNWLFIVIVLGIIAIQTIIVQVGGVTFHCVPLTWDQWLFCVGFEFLSIPMGNYFFDFIH